MNSSRVPAGEVSLLTVALLFGFASFFGFVPSASSQTHPSPKTDVGAKWSLVDAVGYGGLGFGLGVLATWDDRLDGRGSRSGLLAPPDAALAPVGATTLRYGIGSAWIFDDHGPSGTTLVVIGATTVAGTRAGAVIGRRAQRAVAERSQIDGLHRPAVIGGAVMAGGTLGALASVPLIKGSGEGTPLGSDEQTFALMVLAGSGLGTLFVFRNRHEFGPRSVTLAPARFGHAGYGLHVLLR